MVRPFQQEGFRGVAHRALVSGIRRGQTCRVGLAHENESPHARVLHQWRSDARCVQIEYLAVVTQ
jgi:hypothetical protein